MRKFLKWIAIGFGGLVVLAIVLAAVSPPPEDSPPAQGAQPTVAPTSKPTPRPTPRRTPTPTVEDCFNAWDGNLDALEDLVRPLLNDEGSMQTHETRFSSEPDAAGYHSVRMEYSAHNAFGARIKTYAYGRVHWRTCHVVLVDPGF
ncbi:MAG: hypothetical protein F4Z96_03790 [Chloroflexi bacterium]|nr:hypothetical protein [Chloroflexota bacterium]MYB40664.1 hypothetical protein [Chloroflexota bacterium]